MIQPQPPPQPDTKSAEPVQSPGPPRAGAVLAALTMLYTAQGVPFGFASDYLSVVLRRAGYSMGQIAAVGWLQLPCQLKILFAHVADRPDTRRRARGILLVLQLCLAVTVALFALRPLRDAPILWFALTAACALFAATQDVFVDALAVRTLRVEDRGLGNTAQVAGYRVGMLAGGAGLLFLVGRLGGPVAIGLCAALVAAASVGAFALRTGDANSVVSTEEKQASSGEERLRFARMARHLVSPATWPVLALALTYKLGLHMASVLLKPMAVDAHWSDEQIAGAVVTAGTVMALLGAMLGGVLHRVMRESRALALAAVLQALVCVPLLVAQHLGVPLGWTTLAIATEHLATGVGTTVLFAALMTATRPADAGLHYTILTSANALAMGIGSMLGGALADRIGKGPVFAIAGVLCLLPIALLPRWESAARASSGNQSP